MEDFRKEKEVKKVELDNLHTITDMLTVEDFMLSSP